MYRANKDRLTMLKHSPQRVNLLFSFTYSTGLFTISILTMDKS